MFMQFFYGHSQLPIRVVKSDNEKFRVLALYGVHGDEVLQVSEEFFNKIPEGITYVHVPKVNPSLNRYVYANEEVDINRDFYDCKAPQTRDLISLIQAFNFDVILDHHFCALPGDCFVLFINQNAPQKIYNLVKSIILNGSENMIKKYINYPDVPLYVNGKKKLCGHKYCNNIDSIYYLDSDLGAIINRFDNCIIIELPKICEQEHERITINFLENI